jgi:hypothetical protein
MGRFKGRINEIYEVRCGLPSTVTCVEIMEQVDQHTRDKKGIRIGESVSEI